VGQIGSRDHARAGKFGNEAGFLARGLAEYVLRRFLLQFACEYQGAPKSGQRDGRIFALDDGVNSGHVQCESDFRGETHESSPIDRVM
jgi:hypothetical protein